MVDQGDGVHAWPEEPAILLGGGNWGDVQNIAFEEDMELHRLLEDLERAWNNNNHNIPHISFDNFFNADDENDDSDDNYNFNNDDNQNADSSDDEEDSYESDEDENVLADAEIDLEVNEVVGEVQEDLLLGGSRRWFIEEDSEDERSHLNCWDEFATRSSDEEDSMLESNRGSDENETREGNSNSEIPPSLTVTE